MVLEFNEETATILEKEQSLHGSPTAGFDFSRLTLQEQIELLGYIKSARTVPIAGVQRVVIKKTTIEVRDGNIKAVKSSKNIDDVEVVHDIGYEEMPPNVVKDFKKLPDKNTELEDPDLGSMEVKDLTGGLLKEKKGAKKVLDAVLDDDAKKNLRDKLLGKKK
jgi:hypothetical protein